ncbi:glycosyltransferase family 4 protein [Desulfobulbus sp. F3]|nr:glycosyltransferase family 4 protein [Desulfobulbus sp. F3]
MKNIKVLIVCPWYDPYRIPLLVNLSREFNITVVYSMRKEKGREWIVPDSFPVNVFFLKSILLLKIKIKRMFGEYLFIHYPSGIIGILTKTCPDVIIGLEFRLSNIIAWLWAQLHGRGYIIWSDMTTCYDMRMGFLRTINRKILLARSHALIGSSSDTLSHFNCDFGYPQKKSFLSILSAHINQERMPDSENICKMNRDGNTIKFLYVGDILYRKGVHLLIQAFAKLLVASPGYLLTIVGKGLDQEMMEKLTDKFGCSNSVIFRGSIPYESVPNEMICHDIFVFPTLIDAFGLVVAEAAACGLPVICSRYAGAASDLVKDNGLVIDPENIDELTSAMEYLACNPHLRCRMAAAGKLLLQKNDMQAAVKGYGDAIRLAFQTSRKQRNHVVR